MADYNKWTKEDLIKRVKQLEIELKDGPQDALPHPTRTASGHNLENGDTETTHRPGQPVTKKPNQTKSMDPSRYSTRFIALKLAYIGKKYNGFEYQSSGVQSTIEEELWKALVKACLVFPNPEKPNEVDWTVCEYSKCGRTDRGVSAFGQVVALRVRSNKPVRREAAAAAAAPMVEGGGEETTTTNPAARNGQDVAMNEAAETVQEEDDAEDTPLPAEQEIQYCRVLNRLLPPDIRVYAWCANPPPDFSARFSCRERQYRYFFTQPAFAPLPNFLDNHSSTTTTTTTNTNTSTKPKDGWVDIAAMRKAAKLFEGLHDFRNFCKIDPTKQITNFQRRIFEADIVEVDGVDSAIPYLSSPQFRDPTISSSTTTSSSSSPKVYYFHVRGSAFLWHQIRCMVAILFLVGQGHETPDVVAQLLDTAAHPRRPNYILADDAPLVLWDCLFGRGINNNADGAADEVDWLYMGGLGDSPMNLHGSNGLAGDLWAFWRDKKMDEILANRLLDWVSRKTGMLEEEKEIPLDRLEGTGTGTGTGTGKGKGKGKGKGTAVVNSTRVYEGGNSAKLAGAWVPVMKKPRMQSPEEMNDRYALRKGFKSAEEMRALGNWRDAIREAKEKGAAMEAAQD
ncbi:unnamed protein product [Discula destructiva]